MQFDITIVTSSANYGHYLKEWAESIIAQTRRPSRVVIVDNASDGGADDAFKAGGLIKRAGMPVLVRWIEDRVDFGTARNLAVSLAESEWVMHLDADDRLMPHCLADCAELESEADVIALGYERDGDVAAGPNNRTRIYSDTRGEQTLNATAPASGVSPFRKRFWDARPYRTDMRGGWDTALWLGFAHMNARFKATRRPVFWYRQHADSVFNTRRLNARASAITGMRLQSIRRGDEGVTIVIPWQDVEDPTRDAALDAVRAFYRQYFPDWQLVVGQTRAGVWQKGVAVADGLSHASGETLVIADADCVVNPSALYAAVSLVQNGTAPWIVPHTMVYRLDEESTLRYYADPSFELNGNNVTLARPAYEGFAGGGIVVVGRPEFEAVGGIPFGFMGWGSEDEALALILDTLLGAHKRLDFDLYHLWHTPSKRGKQTHYRDNRVLLAQLQTAAANDPDLLFSVLASRIPLTGAALVRGAGQRRNLKAEREISRLNTLATRQLQRQRNEEANETRHAVIVPSFEDRKLALVQERKRKGK